MKRAYVLYLSIFFILSISFSVVYAEEEHLYTNITVTATIPLAPPGASMWAPTSTPINSGVPLSVEAGTDTVLFRGVAFPQATISLLKNAVTLATTSSAINGAFQIGVRNLTPGIYSFGLQASDNDGIKTSLEIITVYVASGITTLVDGVFLSPTITSDLISVGPGDSFTLSGNAVPNTFITVTIQEGDTKVLKKTMSDENGGWNLMLNSTEFSPGAYSVKARSSTADDLSSFSPELDFIIGDESRLRAKATNLGARARCDVNNDSRVDIKDFSILAYWYNRLGFPQKVDLNDDGNFDLTDFSILAYCWTG